MDKAPNKVEWHDASDHDNLPERRLPVLVAYSYDDEEKGRVIEVAESFNWRWGQELWQGFHEQFYEEQNGEVFAWAYMPEPPETKKSPDSSRLCFVSCDF